MPWDGVEKRTSKFHEVQAECIKRTMDALAEGHSLASELEVKILEMRHERETQMAEMNLHLAALGKDLALLAQSVTALVAGTEKEHAEVVDIRALATASEKRITNMENWQIAEAKKHEAEELEKKESIAQAEEERKERIKPWKETMWRVVQWAAIFAVGVIATAVYEYIKRGGL